MLNLWKDLLIRLGLKRTTRRRYYRLDEQFELKLQELARVEGRHPNEVGAALIEAELTRREPQIALQKCWNTLSAREQEVAALVCLNHTNRQVASKLGLSPATIKTHVMRLLEKFNLHSKAELRRALQDWNFSGWDDPAE